MARSKLSSVSITELQREIERRKKLLPKLMAERDALDRRIALLQGTVATKAAAPAQPKAARKAAKATRRRASNKVSLADALAAALKGKDKVTVGEAMNAVLASGYKSTATNFRNVVNNMLLSDKRFKKVGRGEFTLKA